MKRQPRNLAREVANATVVLGNELPSIYATSHGARHAAGAIIEEAKRLQRLQTQRRQLRARLKAIEADIRHSKQMLRALAGGAEPKARR